MKRPGPPAFVVAVLLALLCPAVLHAYDYSIQGVSISPGSTEVAPGQTDIPVAAFLIENTTDTARTIASVTFTYKDTVDDVAPGSVALRSDGDKDIATRDWTPVGSAQTLTGDKKATFTGMTIPSNESRLLVITLGIASSAGKGHHVSGEVRSDGIVADGDLPPFGAVGGPTYTVTPPAPKATKLLIDAPSTAVAGQSVSFTVSCVDDNNAVVTEYAKGSLALGWTPGHEPSGGATYSGGGAWTSADQGVKHCSFTMVRAESGRRVHAENPGGTLAAADSGDITVTAGSSGVVLKTVANQVAGVPFSVTLMCQDGYGNPVAGRAGAVTTISAGDGIGPSPGGKAPVFPAPYHWTGTESNGQKIVSDVVLYKYSASARLAVSDSLTGNTVSNVFTVSPGTVAVYGVSGTLDSGQASRFTFAVEARDGWGNGIPEFNSTGMIVCSDPLAVVLSSISITNGAASFPVQFQNWGPQTLTVTDATRKTVKGAASVEVTRPVQAKNFKVVVPSAVTAGKPFAATINACDDRGATVTAYSHPVAVGATSPATVSPSTVTVVNGSWRGTLSISGETFSARISVSDGVVTSISDGTLSVSVPGFETARCYPAVFTPRNGPLHIRYFLRENARVKVTVYNALMDAVRELSFDAGRDGGTQGLNVIEWDGRGGDSGVVGH